ncbi:MAG: YchJ family protein [Magnetospirillum sp. WYHS-4]
MTTISCPCGSGQGFDTCCGPLIAGAPAPTAEALMRSRYSAFVHRTFDYLERTHAPEIQGDFSRSAAESLADQVEWLGLEIRGVEGGGPDDQTGAVEFAARFSRQGQEQIHHELASFRREQGIWVYVDGKMNPKPPPRHVVKVGRNDPCPCGSGKKYKKCCGT